METILDELNPQNRAETTFRDYLPRIHDVRSPCQWLTHCDNGKCPAFTRINGNFYCAKHGIH